jgi:hypothetical protein
MKMPELNPDSIERTTIDARTIDPKKNTAVKDWAAREGWGSPSEAKFEADSNMGVWVWRDQVRGPAAVLAIDERLVARLLADDLVLALGARVGEIRRQVKARIWDNGLVTRY